MGEGGGLFAEILNLQPPPKEKAASAADRGKGAETKVRDRLNVLANAADVAFWRPPDLRAGSMQPALCDFLVMYKGRLTLLEVKETAKDGVLPCANFSSDQVARMQKWRLAGANSMVLVLCTKTGMWRALALDRFIQRPSKYGSWDLKDVTPNTLEHWL